MRRILEHNFYFYQTVCHMTRILFMYLLKKLKKYNLKNYSFEEFLRNLI